MWFVAMMSFSEVTVRSFSLGPLALKSASLPFPAAVVISSHACAAFLTIADMSLTLSFGNLCPCRSDSDTMFRTRIGSLAFLGNKMNGREYARQ